MQVVYVLETFHKICESCGATYQRNYETLSAL